MPLSVVIVGSGPAGFYAAEALLKSGEADVRVDILDRLPTPFGLIRAGVAPDHQTTKKVAKSFERTALRDEVRYYGNVDVGRDVRLPELREIYDAVVLAVGAPFDRPLGIPGENKAGVYGSAAFVGWYNGHPDFRDLEPDLNTGAVAVVGVGNVAIDVARVLVKTSDEMAASDIPDYAARAIRSAPITDVYMFGRRGPVEAKFTNVELREMGKLENCVPVVDAAQLPEDVGDIEGRDRRIKERNLASLREFVQRSADEKPKRVHFQFYAAPVEVLGGETGRGAASRANPRRSGPRRRLRRVLRDPVRPGDPGRRLPLRRTRRGPLRREDLHRAQRRRPRRRRPVRGRLDQAGSHRGHRHQPARRGGGGRIHSRRY